MYSVGALALAALVLVIVLGLVALLVFVISGAVGVDALFRLNEPKADLICWHCGLATRAGRRKCQNCGEDLR
jgi:hypothetical protein